MVLLATAASRRGQALPLQATRRAADMNYNCSTSLRCEMPIRMGKTLVRLFAHHLQTPLASCGLPRYLCSGDLPQVVGQNAPTHPPLHPFFFVIEATTESEDATEHADASFDPRSEPETSSEPTLFFVSFSLLARRPFLGKTTRFTPNSSANLSFCCE